MDTRSVRIGLHGLPLEVLQQIASHLGDSHRPSVYTFGLTSKTCHRAASFIIFHHVHLKVSSIEALQQEIDALTKTLAYTDSARHVRCLNIKGSLHIQRSKEPEASREYLLDDSSLAYLRLTGIDEVLTDEEFVSSGEYIVNDEPIIKRHSEEDVTWAPVVDLVKMLSSLTKLVYDCQNQFPPSLLETLHTYHPQCKLHHYAFQLRTLLCDTPDIYEMALATSPCLYSVKVQCSPRDSDGVENYNEEATMELASGLAPNLKEVIIVNRFPMRAIRFRDDPRDPWKHLPGFISGRTIGSLTSLSLVGAAEFDSSGLIQAWARATEFSSLNHLVLGGGIASDSVTRGISGEVMECIAQNFSFPCLKTLRVRLSRDEYHIARPEYGDNAVAFFTAFKPLSELSVTGPMEPKIFDAILDQHGRMLGKLTLHPQEATDSQTRETLPMKFKRDHVLKIGTRCPKLEELSIPVQRMQSNIVEVDIYRSFAKLPSLRHLFLILDCSDLRVLHDSNYEDPPFDENDRQGLDLCGGHGLKKGHVRAAFVNCAVDETLARSIWETICKDKVGRKMDSLKLWTTGGGRFSTSWRIHDICEVCELLSRSWLIERTPREDVEAINIMELGQRARKKREEEWSYWMNQCEAEMEGGNSLMEEDRELIQIVRSIWPRKEGSTDWREDWSSFPLHI